MLQVQDFRIVRLCGKMYSSERCKCLQRHKYPNPGTPVSRQAPGFKVQSTQYCGMRGHADNEYCMILLQPSRPLVITAFAAVIPSYVVVLPSVSRRTVFLIA